MCCKSKAAVGFLTPSQESFWPGIPNPSTHSGALSISWADISAAYRGTDGVWGSAEACFCEKPLRADLAQSGFICPPILDPRCHFSLGYLPCFLDERPEDAWGRHRVMKSHPAAVTSRPIRVCGSAFFLAVSGFFGGSHSSSGFQTQSDRTQRTLEYPRRVPESQKYSPEQWFSLWGKIWTDPRQVLDDNVLHFSSLLKDRAKIKQLLGGR